MFNALSSSPASLALAAATLIAAIFAAQQSVALNLQRACVVGDTPYLDLCASPSTSRQRAAELRSEIFANPGASRAYVRLAFAEKTNAAPLLDAAARLAPANANITAMRAGQALEKQDLPSAVGPLVSLVEHEHSDPAALVLARLIVGGRWQLLAEYVVPGAHWFERVLTQMGKAQGSFAAALPLVVLGLDRGVFTPLELMPYVGLLKSSGAWGDAYSLWVALHKGVSPIIYNAGFDRAFEENGFDWEVAAQHAAGRAGALVGRAADETHGSTLDIRFTGRPFAVPLVRQYLFLGPGRYRLRGDYKAAQLRMEEGLAWTVRCTASAVQAGKSAGLNDTGNAWQPFEFEFSVPRNCGWVASLQLETFTPIQATLGSRGRAAFDSLALQQVERQ
jgi:hypothetical protein